MPRPAVLHTRIQRPGGGAWLILAPATRTLGDRAGRVGSSRHKRGPGTEVSNFYAPLTHRSLHFLLLSRTLSRSSFICLALHLGLRLRLAGRERGSVTVSVSHSNPGLPRLYARRDSERRAETRRNVPRAHPRDADAPRVPGVAAKGTLPPRH